MWTRGAMLLVTLAACDPDPPPLPPPPSSDAASAGAKAASSSGLASPAALRDVERVLRKYAGGGTHWDIDGAVHLAPQTLEVQVEGLAGKLASAAQAGACAALALPDLRCADDAEVTLTLAAEPVPGGIQFAFGGRPRVKRYGVRPVAGLIHAVAWHGIEIRGKADAVRDAAGAAGLGRALASRWEQATRGALMADARPMGATVLRTVVRDAAAAARVTGAHEQIGRPVWVGGERVWGVFSAGGDHLVHVLEPSGATHAAIFAGLDVEPRGGASFASFDATGRRLLYAVDHWLPWSGEGPPPRPKLECDEPTCRGITVVAVDEEGALSRGASFEGYAVVGNAVAHDGAIYTVGGKGKRAFVLRREGAAVTSVAVPRIDETDWAYRIEARGTGLVVESPAGLYRVAPSLAATPEPLHRFAEVRNAAAVGFDVAFDDEGGILVHEKRGDTHILRRLPIAGEAWRVTVDSAKPWWRIGTAGDFVYVGGVGLFRREDGARIGPGDALARVEPSFATVGEYLVGCTERGVGRWSVDGRIEVEVPLPWRCRAVGPGPDGKVLVATSYPVGAYVLQGPSVW